MFNNGKMKLAAIVFITVLTVSGASAAISDIDMDPLLSQYEKGASITVTGTVYGTDIDKVTLQRETDYGGSVNVGNDKDLGYCSYGCKVSIDYTFKETGTHDFFLRAFDDEQRKNSNFETVDVVQLKEAGFKLKDVKATGYTLEEHNSTYLQAVVKNTGEAGGSVLVKWYADNGEKTLLAKKWQYLSSGERETLQSSELTWENLKNSLTVGEDYQLVGELYFNGEKLGSMTSSYGKLHLEKKETRPSLSIKTVDEEDNALENVKISINGESYKTRSNGKLELELKQGAYTIKASKSGYKDADKSIYLSKGESESIKLELGRKKDMASLRVKTVDFNGEKLEEVTIEINGKSYETKSNGELDIKLNQGAYTVKAFKKGYRGAEESVYLGSGESESIKLRLKEKGTEKAFLSVKTVDSSGDIINYSEVRLAGQTWNTYGDGMAIFYVKPGSYTLKASASGYKDAEKGIYLSPGEYQVETIKLEKETREEPEKGKLRVYTGEVNQDGPTYVDVEVDGKTENTGSNDLAIFNLNQGSYTVSASANGEYSEESVYLSSGETETVYLGLPADNGEDKAVLTVNTMSGGEKLRYVDVTVNGETKSTGSDGTAVFRLESGGYEIDAEKDGYIDASRGVYLSQGEEQEETLQLEKKDVDKECEISVGRVQISDKTISKGESTEVSLRIDSGSVKQDFQVFADTEESTYMDKTITVDGVRTITKTVTPENDVKVYTQVEAVGSPCGYEKWESSDEIIVSSTGEDEENKLTVDVEDRDGDNIENAEVRISNGADREKETGENGRARFELENGDYELEVSKEGYREITREFSINGEDKELDITLSKIDGEEEDKGHFTARVVNQNGDRLEDARVKVENDDSITKWTSDDGEASFNLEPGDYEVTVWKPGYTTRTDEIEIEEDDDFTRGYKLHKEQDLKVSSLNYPETVCRGSSMSVSFQVENQGNSKEVIDISGEGLGSSINGRSLILDAGEEKRTSIIFTNIQGSGSESFTVKASNTDSDTGSGTVNVESCGITNYGQASDISLSINPDRALSGRPVQVKGYVDGAQGRSEVTVKVDGKKVGEVSTQPDGYFQTYIRVSQVGMHSVSVETDSISANRNLEVLPTVSATMIDPPREVFEGEEFELCAQINSQINPKVVLLRDGVVMQTRQASGKVCFTPTASNPGEHEYMIRAVTYGEGTAATARIKVLETGPETTSFPESIASVESESGVVKAEIYNTHDELRRYHVKLEGLPEGWVSTSEKEVVLSKGERDTVYFYVMPKEEGSYSGDIVIESDGSEIYRENVTVWSGGTKKDQSKTWIGKLKKLWPF